MKAGSQPILPVTHGSSTSPQPEIPMRPLVLALPLVLAASPLLAQSALSPCSPPEAFAGWLMATHGETPRALGVAAGQGATTALMQLWENAETGTWTLSLTPPDGLTCIITHGTGMEILESVKGDPA